MNSTPYLRFLRLYACKDVLPARKAAYLRFYSLATGNNGSARCQAVSQSHERKVKNSHMARYSSCAVESTVESMSAAERHRSGDVAQRVKELEDAQALNYPQIGHDTRAMSCEEFKNRYDYIKVEEMLADEIVTLRGRIWSVRTAGSKLVFLDVNQNNFRVQSLCNLSKLKERGVERDEFKDSLKLFRRGDVVSITGVPYRTQRGELSLNAIDLPKLLSPSLATLPTKLEDVATRVRSRHADLLVNQRAADTLKLRSHIIQYIRDFLIKDEFLEVETPIICDGAGGAVARPFMTSATEFPEKELSLRIAPELWLKRLILGGMDRVFEIGTVFRNEGLDLTHNPEFTTCEFYKSFADLDELINMTEKMISGMAQYVNNLIEDRFTALSPVDLKSFSAPFNRVQFIPAIEAAINRKLPDLSTDDAPGQITQLFSDLGLQLPSSPTLPRMLDKLASTYIEPSCVAPTFISHHPVCMSPLAKSFTCETTNQIVSARVELFIKNHEIANMYEEENSPFEQRVKFEQQAKYRDEENRAIMDESYLEALEWGLPPTGGWGCGIDRICMLFSGATRISDVLAFGNLRNVVGLGHDTKGK